MAFCICPLIARPSPRFTTNDMAEAGLNGWEINYNFGSAMQFYQKLNMGLL